MTRNLDSKKIKLIEEIASINSEAELDMLVKAVELIRLSGKHGESIFQETKNSISVASLIKEQNFEGINRSDFDRLVNELDVKESIEELLAMVD